MDLRSHIFVPGLIVDPLWSPLIEISYHFLGSPPNVGFTTDRKERFQLELQGRSRKRVNRKKEENNEHNLPLFAVLGIRIFLEGERTLMCFFWILVCLCFVDYCSSQAKGSPFMLEM